MAFNKTKTDPELGQQIHEHLVKMGVETPMLVQKRNRIGAETPNAGQKRKPLGAGGDEESITCSMGMHGCGWLLSCKLGIEAGHMYT